MTALAVDLTDSDEARCALAVRVLDARHRGVDTEAVDAALWRACLDDAGKYAAALVAAANKRLERDKNVAATPRRATSREESARSLPATSTAAPAATSQPSKRPVDGRQSLTGRTPAVHPGVRGVRPGWSRADRFADWIVTPRAQWMTTCAAVIFATVLIGLVAR